VKPCNFRKKSKIYFGNRNGLCFKYLFNCQKSVSTRTLPVFFGWMKVGAARGPLAIVTLFDDSDLR
jgi:hypothetical protein